MVSRKLTFFDCLCCCSSYSLFFSWKLQKKYFLNFLDSNFTAFHCLSLLKSNLICQEPYWACIIINIHMISNRSVMVWIHYIYIKRRKSSCFYRKRLTAHGVTSLTLLPPPPPPSWSGRRYPLTEWWTAVLSAVPPPPPAVSQTGPVTGVGGTPPPKKGAETRGQTNWNITFPRTSYADDNNFSIICWLTFYLQQCKVRSTLVNFRRSWLGTQNLKTFSSPRWSPECNSWWKGTV